MALWQPILVLGVVSFVVGGLFYTQRKNELNPVQSKNSKGKFCTHCGKKIQSKHKFCAHCGGKL